MVCDPNAIALASCSQQHHPSPTTTPKVNRHAGHAYCCPRPHKDLLAKSQVCVEGLVLSVKLRLQWHDSHIQELFEDRVCCFRYRKTSLRKDRMQTSPSNCNIFMHLL